MTNIDQPILSHSGSKKRRKLNNTDTELQWIDHVFPFLCNTDIAKACFAFNLAYPMDLFKHRVEKSLQQRAPRVIDGLLNTMPSLSNGAQSLLLVVQYSVHYMAQ